MSYTLWPHLGFSAVKEHMEGRRIGHACILETSMMMHLRPDIVRKDALVEGEMQKPIFGDINTSHIKSFAYYNEYSRNGAFEGAPDATAEIGEKLTRQALDKAADFIKKYAEIDFEGEAGVPMI
jgi:creatinine amidohydrolase/Fe(II)-dependent formamide hydrolase-like protein